MRNNNRIEEFDMMKAIAMIMVVVYHTTAPLHLRGMLSYVHVPLFFILAGCTNKQDDFYYEFKNVLLFIKKRIKRLYIPYVLFSLFIVLTHNLLYRLGIYSTQYTPTGLITQIIRTLLFSVGTAESCLPQMWFIKTLFFGEIFYAFYVYITQKFNKQIRLATLILGIFAIEIIDYFIDMPQPVETFIIRPLTMIPFYLIGKNYKTLLSISTLSDQHRYKKFFHYLYIGVYIIIWYSVASYYQEIKSISLLTLIVQLIFSPICFIILWNWFQKLKKQEYITSALTYIGKNSMSIYFLHYLMFITISFVWSTITQDSLLNGRMFIDNIPWWGYSVGAITFSLIIDYLYSMFKQALKAGRNAIIAY